MVNNIDTNAHIKRDEFIFELIRKRMDDEFERINNLDNKANNIIGFTSLIVGILVGIGTLEIFSKTELYYSFIYLIGIGMLLTSILYSLWAFKVRKWTVVPKVQTLIAKYTTLEYEEVLKRNAGEMAKAVLILEKNNDEKARFLILSWYSLISGLSILFIFIIVSFLLTR
ncbi:MAG TPA: hypothetical protein VFZ46_05210 [Nitrososphaeraceae archaeon]